MAENQITSENRIGDLQDIEPDNDFQNADDEIQSFEDDHHDLQEQNIVAGANDDLEENARKQLSPSKAAPAAPTPVDKPQSAYMLFMKGLKDDQEFQKHIESVKQMKGNFLEEASKKWKSLDDAAKQPFYDQQRRQKNKYEMYQQQLIKYKQLLGEEGFDIRDMQINQDEEQMQMRRKFIQLPQSRVRQVCALDDEFRLISKEALLLITKATEMFVTDLAGTAGRVARQQNRKTMQVQDILNVASYIDKFHFISDSKLPTLNPKKNEEQVMQKQLQNMVDDGDFAKMEQEVAENIERQKSQQTDQINSMTDKNQGQMEF